MSTVSHHTDNNQGIETVRYDDKITSIIDPSPFTEKNRNGMPGVPDISLLTVDGHKVSFHSQPVITIGRKDAERNIYPSLDLKDYNAYRYGVSRKHAKLTFLEGRFFITDLGSRNGTYINGDLIAPHQMTPVYEGDNVKFGHFEIRIASISS